MVRRRAVLIGTVFLLGTILSVFLTLGQPRIYEAIAVAQIESPAVADPGTAGTPTTNPVDHRLRILEQKLMARDNLSDMLERYNLYEAGGLSEGLRVAQLRESVRITQITDPNAPFGVARVPTGMMITVSDSNAQTAAALANDFLDQLVELNRTRRARAAQQNLEFFKSEAVRLEAEIANMESQIAAFKEKNAPYLPAGVAAQRDELGTLRSALLDIEQKLIELDASRTRQRAEVIERQSGLLREQQALIQQRIKQIDATIASAPEVERQFGILTRKLDQLKEQNAVIIRGATEAEMGQLLTSQEQFERVEVLERALVPENPVSGSRKKKVAMGMVLSGFAGVVLAFILESLNPVIRTPMQLQRELNVKAVVSIPNLNTKKDKRRRKLIWVSVLAVLAALFWVAMGVIRDGVSMVRSWIARPTSKA